jgi:hypothetical protein
MAGIADVAGVISTVGSGDGAIDSVASIDLAIFSGTCVRKRDGKIREF